jgi:hypothetical protein
VEASNLRLEDWPLSTFDEPNTHVLPADRDDLDGFPLISEAQSELLIRKMEDVALADRGVGDGRAVDVRAVPAAEVAYSQIRRRFVDLSVVLRDRMYG